MGRYHLYIDESGQPGPDGFFLPCVVALPVEQVLSCRHEMEELERGSGRMGRKWVHSNLRQKEAFLLRVDGLLQAGRVMTYWSLHPNGDNLVAVTARFTAKVAAKHFSGMKFNVVLDGYPDKSLQVVRAAFRERQVVWSKISGPRDEGEPLLRLAGFLADVRKQKEYALRFWTKLENRFQIV